jgi:hypothetical protein
MTLPSKGWHRSKQEYLALGVYLIPVSIYIFG